MAVRPPGAGLPARSRLLAPTVASVAALLLLGGAAVSLYTDLLWFRDVGFPSVFSTVLRTRALLFVGFGLLMAVIIGTNLTVAYRVRPPFRPMSLEQQNLERYRVAVEPYLTPVLLLASGVFGVFAGLSASARWETWLLWRNQTSFGIPDPQFQRDVSYYVMSYPFQRFVLGFLLTAVVLSLLAAAATHYLFGALRLQTVGEKVSPAARAHLSVLVGLVLLLKAWAYYLDRFGLVFSDRGPQVQGASYTDINAVLPAKNVLIGVAIICALLAFANIVVRNILLPGGAVALLVVMAIVFGGIYPAYTQRFRVNPNEAEREAETISRNIAATLTAYDLDEVEVEPYDATTRADEAQIEGGATSTSLGDVRLLDPNVLSDTFRQLQQIRFYYGFAPQLDVDRYDLGDGGGQQDFVVGARELDLTQLNQDQRGWIQEHLIYTHGRGFVAAPANRTDVGGAPVFQQGGIPDRGPLDVEQSRIYFGELSPQYSVVNTEEGEVDGPGESDEDQALFNYDGDGGVQLGSLFRKVLYAIKFREPNLLLSGAIKEDSRIMYDREPAERVEKVAPWLTLDGDPYPAVVDGRLIWIVDGYTTSAAYPYSQRSELGELTADSLTRAQLPDRQVNYIRNSVKATVDAYTGDVELYAFDEDEPDPVLASWRKAFPGVVQDADEISEGLREHLRYPEDLFKVQRDLFAQYHVGDPRAFYSREDFWEIPDDPASSVQAAPAAGANGQQPAGGAQQQQAPAGAGRLTGAGADGAQPPYYLFLRLPGDDRPRFSLSTVFTARNRPNLAAFMAASSDPEDYGRIRVLAPETNDVPGPGQIANTFESNTEVGTTLNLLRQGGSSVILGNLLTLPVGDGLLYVEPVYVQASGGESYPLLRRVLVAFGDDVAFEETLADALVRVFGEGAAAGTPTPAPTGSPSPGASPGPRPGPGAAASIPELAAQAQQAFEEGQAALREGDFAGYGEANERLGRLIEQIAAASGQSGRVSPAPSPSPAG